ncbi:MAG TPA: lamin tail domain-containing protein, partial [bacterium]|nr:lamin tail domain-containing protein [bacterium]HPN32412.1 lamin tail domain-containing protein [bacterium]
ILNPDGDDNNFSSDWSIDPTPTQGFSNIYIIPPSAPESFQSVAGNNFVNLSWTAASQGDYPVAGYNVYRRISSGSYNLPLNDTTIVSTEYGDYTAENGTLYFYIVKTIDEQNNLSGASAEVSASPQAPLPEGSHIVINEIMFDPSGAEPDYEWIELYNPTDTCFNISGWKLTDGEGIYTVPDSSLMAPYTYKVFGYSPLAAGGNADFIYGGYTSGVISLNNTADNVILKDSSNLIIDELDYNGNWGGSAPKSLSRKFAGQNTNVYTNWGKSIADGGTPKFQNDVDTIIPVITHTPVTAALAGKDIVIHFKASDNIAWYSGKKPSLYYRTTGDTEYVYVDMAGIYDDYSAIIPYYDVTISGVQYYFTIEDEFNNKASKPDNFPETNPYNINVFDSSFTIVINEIMFDPPQNEPAEEWIELYNFGTESLDISCWILTDGEGTFTIPENTFIGANDYCVLAFGETAAQGNADIAYGDSMTGQINLSNLFAGLGSDEIILKNTDEIIIDEVDYNVLWGGANGNGPNYLSLERLSPSGESNNGANWSASMNKYGTPGIQNSLHLIWNVWTEPSQINPDAGETAAIRYRLSESCSVTIKIYDNYNDCIKTLINNEYKSTPDTYYVYWDGRNESGDIEYGIFKFEILAVDSSARESLYIYNPAQLITQYHPATYGEYRAWAGEVPIMNFYLNKPAMVSLKIKEELSGKFIRNLISNIPFGIGESSYEWDARTDSGLKTPNQTVTNIETSDIEGNIIIVRKPLNISNIKTYPAAYFDAAAGDSQNLSFFISDTSTVTIKIFSETGGYIKDLLTSAVQYPGIQSLYWDGKDASNNICPDGIYYFKISAINGQETFEKFGECCIYNF